MKNHLNASVVVALFVVLNFGFTAIDKLSAQEDQKTLDKIDLPFVNDPRVIGQWTSVIFVSMPEMFEPDKKKFPGELYLKELVFLKDGQVKDNPWFSWTKDILIHHGDKTAGRYEIKRIQGRNYMFLEWKSGDYTIRHMKPWYYVLGRGQSAQQGQPLKVAAAQAAGALFQGLPGTNVPPAAKPQPSEHAPMSMADNLLLLFALLGLSVALFLFKVKVLSSWKKGVDIIPVLPSETLKSREMEPGLNGTKLVGNFTLAFTVLAMCISFHFGEPFARLYILHAGIPATGISEGFVEIHHSVRAYAWSENLQSFAYETSSGIQHAKGHSSFLLSWPKGLPIKIHYLSDHPNWAALDEDGGQTASSLFAFGAVLSLILFVGIVFGRRSIK